MICKDCNEKIATILFTQIVDNKKTVLHLCKDCAEKRGFQTTEKMPLFPINDFLGGMADAEKLQTGDTGLSCNRCGLTYDEFKKTGKLGCSDCYETFENPLKKLLRKIHGNTIHHGKSPSLKQEKATATRNVTELRKELTKAIENEEFERAAELRDVLKLLKRDKK